MAEREVHVLVTIDFDERQLQRIRAVSPRVVLTSRPSGSFDDIPSEELVRVEVMYSWLLPDRGRAPRLRWIQLHSAGVDYLLDQPIFQTDVMFTSASGVHATNMAEYALAVMLAWSQNLPELAAWHRRGEWLPQARRNEITPRELRGATIGVIGYGSIGREVGRLARAFGMRVLAVKRHPDRRDDPGFHFVGDLDGDAPEAFYGPDDLQKMLPQCDYVVIAVALTDETRGMMGEAEFAVMKPSAYLVNVARGGVCDESALIRTLQGGRIAGAGLDVFTVEPLPADSPLWGMDNVILTPHVSGRTPHYNDRAVDIFVENLTRYLDGRALLNLVDKSTGY